MENLKKGLARFASDLALILGGAAVSAGAGMIYLPAGVIVAGALMIAGVVLSSLGGGDGP